MLLIKFKANYADEFDVEGFKIYNDGEEFIKSVEWFLEDRVELASEKKTEEILAYAKEMYEEDPEMFEIFDDYIYESVLCNGKGMFMYNGKIYTGEIEWCFGTNESIEFSGINDLLDCFEHIYIDDIFATHLQGIFKGKEFGCFPL